MIVLNSKMYSSGNYDTWWYNISTPSELKLNDKIILRLWDAENKQLIREISIPLNKEWLSRINKASTHQYQNRIICKVHVQRRRDKDNFSLYFGKKEDGQFII